MLYIFLLFIAIVLMLVSRRLKKIIIRMYSGEEIKKPSPMLKILGNDLTSVLGAVLVLALILLMVKSKDLEKTSRRNLIAKIEKNNKCIAAEYLATYLAKKTKNKSKALIIFRELSELQQKKNESLLEALKKGFNEKININAVERIGKLLKWNPSKSEIQKSISLSVEEFENIIAKHPECNTIISFVGVPKKHKQLTFWEGKNAPDFAVITDSIYTLGAPVTQGKIIAAIIINPDKRTVSSSKNKSLEDAFKENYLMLTNENLVEIWSKNRKLLKVESTL